MRLRIAAAAAATLLSACAGISSMHAVPGPVREAGAARPASGFEPYRFLVGDWDVGREGEAPALRARFRFGPNESYLWYSVSVLEGGREHPHFEGLLAWNGARRDLDMLLVLDLDGGRVQEQGVVRALGDGTVVRDITATYAPGMPLPTADGRRAGPAGESLRFRQTYTPLDGQRVLTAVERRDEERWVPTFPGSERLLMTRRPVG